MTAVFALGVSGRPRDLKANSVMRERVVVPSTLKIQPNLFNAEVCCNKS